MNDLIIVYKVFLKLILNFLPAVILSIVLPIAIYFDERKDKHNVRIYMSSKQ